MKPFPLYLIVFALFLGSCATSYRTGQTPDDVYYSPGENNSSVAVQDNNRDNGYAAAESNVSYDEGSDYVTYDDGGGSYDYDYYTRRFSMFGQPGAIYNNYYSYSPYGFSSPYAYNSWGMSPYYGGYGGGYYSPYSSWYYPSFSLGLNWGYPYLGGFGYSHYYGGGWGSPYSSYWNGYYNGYYNGKYSYGHYYSPRPATTIAPRRSFTSAANGGTGRTSAPRGATNVSQNAPTRVFRSGNNTNDGNSTGRVSGNANSRPRRVFRPASDERPVVSEGRSSGRAVSRPSRTTVNRSQPAAQPQRQVQRAQPQRTFERSEPRTSTPSNNSGSSSRSSSAPARSFSPRR